MVKIYKLIVLRCIHTVLRTYLPYGSSDAHPCTKPKILTTTNYPSWQMSDMQNFGTSPIPHTKAKV